MPTYGDKKTMSRVVLCHRFMAWKACCGKQAKSCLHDQLTRKVNKTRFSGNQNNIQL